MYKLIILAGSLILQFLKAYKFHQKIKRKIKLLHTIFKIVPLTPTQIIQKFKDSAESQLLTICKGIISAPEKTTAILNQRKQVIYTRLEYSATNLISLFKKKLLRVKQPSYLKLSDDKNSLSIFETHYSQIMPAEKIYPKDSKNLFQIFKDTLRLIFYKKNSLDFDLKIQSILRKQSIYENYISDHSQCSIFGTFVKESDDVCCYKPLIISSNKQKMIERIQHKYILNQIGLIFMIIIAIPTILFLIKEINLLYQRHKTKTHDFMRTLTKIFVKQRICKLCNKNLSCILSKQCSHMVICDKCSEKSKQTCLQCKKKIKEIIEIHVC